MEKLPIAFNRDLPGIMHWTRGEPNAVGVRFDVRPRGVVVLRISRFQYVPWSSAIAAAGFDPLLVHSLTMWRIAPAYYVPLWRSLPPPRDVGIAWSDVAGAALAFRAATLWEIARSKPSATAIRRRPPYGKKSTRTPPNWRDLIACWLDVDRRAATPDVLYDLACQRIEQTPAADNPAFATLEDILDVLRPDVNWPDRFDPPDWARPPVDPYPLFAGESDGD